MSIDWRSLLGWQTNELSELRFNGFSFLREGHYDKALLYFEALTILDPMSAYDLQTLGAIYLQIGKKELALETLNRALMIDPTHEPTLLNKAKALLLLNQRSQAIAITLPLEKSSNPTIAGDATALRLAYS